LHGKTGAGRQRPYNSRAEETVHPQRQVGTQGSAMNLAGSRPTWVSSSVYVGAWGFVGEGETQDDRAPAGEHRNQTATWPIVAGAAKRASSAKPVPDRHFPAQ